MPKKTDQTETRILKLFSGNTTKTFSFETLLSLLPKKTRREKLAHSLSILKKQSKILEISHDIFQLNPSLTELPKSKKSIENNTKDTSKIVGPESKFIPKVNMKKNIYEGIIDISSSTGSVFVMIDNIDRDPIIRQKDTPRVFQGDRVKVRVTFGKDGKRPEAELIEVVERKIHKLIGKIHRTERDIFLEPLSRKVKQHFYISYPLHNSAKNGDFVIAEFIDWKADERSPRAKVLEILSPDAFHDIEMNAILLEKGFETEFPQEVLDELKDVSIKIDPKELAYRLDYRNVFTITIDPADSRDFDDAISLQKLPNGNWEVGVHIADVSHFVRPNTQLDAEALERATSVYLPDRVAPMLPELLSNDLCSLNPNVERYAFSAIFEVNDQAKVLSEKIAKTIIKSNRRFSYEEAQEIIETKKGDYAEEILTLDRLAKIWREERVRKGAINFKTSEVRFKFDEKGKPIEVYEKVQKDSNLLIEDYMLMANVAVAKFLATETKKKKIPAGIYRNHDLPSMEKLAQFSDIAYRLGGHKLKTFDDPKKASKILNDFLGTIAEKTEASILNQLAIKSMAKAQYSTDNIGHYGLAFEYYTHFTSPIRRYPDLLVHRLLQQVLYGVKFNANKNQLEELCMICNTQEKRAAECEREGIRYKQVEYLSYRIGQKFKGVISGAVQSGFWVELEENKCEGFVELANQFKETFEYDANRIALTARNGKYAFCYGDIVEVEIWKVSTQDKKVWLKILV